MARLIDRVQRFLRRPLKHKLLLLEAYALLFLARLAVRLLPFQRVARWCGTHGEETPTSEPPMETLVAIRWAITTASRYGFWNCRCLTQALAGKAMLRRRGLASTLTIGLAHPGTQQFSAHAWLRCGSVFLTGGEEHDRFKPMAHFT